MEHLIAPAINLGILVVFLFVKLRQPVKDAVAQRHTNLRDEIQKAREQLRAAKAQFDEFNKKLGSMDAEIAALREQARQDSQQAKTTLINQARKLSINIVSDAKAAAQGLYADLRGQLYTELGAHVLERAERLLHERLTGDERAKIRQDFSRQLESVQ